MQERPLFETRFPQSFKVSKNFFSILPVFFVTRISGLLLFFLLRLPASMARKKHSRRSPIRSRSRERSRSTVSRHRASRSPSKSGGGRASAPRSSSSPYSPGSPAISPWRGTRERGRRFTPPYRRVPPVQDDPRGSRSRVRRSRGRRSPAGGGRRSNRRPSRGPSTSSAALGRHCAALEERLRRLEDSRVPAG